MVYSIDPISDNCYPGTTVLINKLDISDVETLNEAEALATYINASTTGRDKNPPSKIEGGLPKIIFAA